MNSRGNAMMTTTRVRNKKLEKHGCSSAVDTKKEISYAGGSV